MNIEARCRATDPMTSLVAAKSLNTQPIADAVLDCLTARGEHGATIDELTFYIGMQKTTISPMLRPLCRKGYVKETGGKRKGVSGRKQTVWALI